MRSRFVGDQILAFESANVLTECTRLSKPHFQPECVLPFCWRSNSSIWKEKYTGHMEKNVKTSFSKKPCLAVLLDIKFWHLKVKIYWANVKDCQNVISNQSMFSRFAGDPTHPFWRKSILGICKRIWKRHFQPECVYPFCWRFNLSIWKQNYNEHM